MKLYLLTVLLLHPFGGGEQLVHALFMHHAPYKEEAHRPLLRVGLAGVVLQIDARAVQHHVPSLRYHAGGSEGVTIPGVLEKHDLRALQRRSIERQHKLLQPAAVFDGAAKSRDVHSIGDVRHPAGKAAVDVGLDGIGQNKVGLDFFQHGAVLPEKLAVVYRVHTAALNRRVNKAAAKLHKLRNETAVRQRDIYLVSCTQKRCKQVLSKAVQANIVVGKHQNPLI